MKKSRLGEKKTRAVPVTVEELAQIRKRVRRDEIPAFCGVSKCGRPHHSMNLCRAHYQKAYENLPNAGYKKSKYPEPDLVAVAACVVGPNNFTSLMMQRCRAPRCDGRWYGRGFCRKHYGIWYRQVNREGK